METILTREKEVGGSLPVVTTAQKLSLFDLPFDNLTEQGLLQRVEGFLAGRKAHFICTPNAALVVWSKRDAYLREIFLKADLLVVDGMAVFYASKLLGRPLAAMVGAPALFFALIEMAAQKGYRIFLFGTTDPILKEAVARLKKQYPTLEIAGFRNVFFSKNHFPQIF